MSVSDLIKLFVRTRAHRVAVCDQHHILRNIVSLTDVVHFAARHLAMLPNAAQTLDKLGLVRTVVAVMMDASVVEALDALYRNRISGLALLNPDGGKVAANFSASDLRALTNKSFRDFNRSILLYLTRSGQGITPVATVKSDQTLADTITAIVKNKVHRVYLVNESDTIRGVCSMVDIVRFLYETL